jgi:lipid II:glycine glycyltransferase (peptidoglycan interpeptide bridge formation enzyme)
MQPATTHPLKVVHSAKTQSDAWHQFLIANDGSYLQSLTWTENDNFSMELLLLLRGDEIVAGCQYQLIKYPIIGWTAYIYHGPCYSNNHPEILETLAKEIKKLISHHNIHFITLAPNIHQDEFTRHLKEQGFKIKSPHLPPSSIVKSTLILNLEQSIDDIYKQVKKSRRNSIRKSLSSPITYKMGSKVDLPVFYKLMMDTCIRRNSKPLVASYSKMEQLYNALDTNNWVVMHLAIVEEQIICASLGITFGKTYRNWFWGWDGQYANYNISDGIDWHTINWAKENGFSFYDFVHVDAISAEAIESTAPVPENIKTRDHFGSTFYKMQFGGRVMHYPPAFCLFSHSVLCLLINTVAAKLLEFQMTKKLLRWMKKTIKRKNLVNSNCFPFLFGEPMISTIETLSFFGV